MGRWADPFTLVCRLDTVFCMTLPYHVGQRGHMKFIAQLWYQTLQDATQKQADSCDPTCSILPCLLIVYIYEVPGSPGFHTIYRWCLFLPLLKSVLFCTRNDRDSCYSNTRKWRSHCQVRSLDVHHLTIMFHLKLLATQILAEEFFKKLIWCQSEFS